MKLHIFIGISGSGKSTKAKEMMEENPSIIRLNRDDIRTCIAGSTIGYYASPMLKQRERIVTHIISSSLTHLYHKKKEIIYDNTNLNYHRLKDLIKRAPKDYEIVFHIFHPEVELSKERVLNRDGEIDVSYITKQAEMFSVLMSEFNFKGEIINYEV